MLDAIDQQASDIHFEPYENFLRIRFRIDGMLYEVAQQPIEFSNFITARLKVLANLDVSERRLPQDGRLFLTLANNTMINFRLSTCPILQGEKAVLRILQSSKDLLPIHHLGMETHQLELFHEALSVREGIILVTGPTGSGKTVTLYSALQHLNTSTVNLSSVEDPIEIQLSGVNQVQVNLKTGLTFAKILRAFLRQDPDIIMVGEIRDLETAEIAIRAAQTGHLILSTLHTNNALQTLERLTGLGIPSFNITNSIRLIIAQRLLRCLCQHCKEPSNYSNEYLIKAGFSKDELPDIKLFEARGCKYCHEGYKGRIGIYEILPIKNSKLLINEINSLRLTAHKLENMQTLRRSGLNTIKAGITSLEELNRVVNNYVNYENA